MTRWVGGWVGGWVGRETTRGGGGGEVNVEKGEMREEGVGGWVGGRTRTREESKPEKGEMGEEGVESAVPEQAEVQ